MELSFQFVIIWVTSTTMNLQHKTYVILTGKNGLSMDMRSMRKCKHDTA